MMRRHQGSRLLVVSARLFTRLEQLRKQHAWGDLTDANYRAERDRVRVALSGLPDGDRMCGACSVRPDDRVLPGLVPHVSGILAA